MPDLYSHIAETIRELRTSYDNNRGISQEALAKKIEEPANTVSRWETATYRPTAEHLEQLARFFGVSITKFFPGMEPTETPKGLASAIRGLGSEDLEEVIRYAEFRRARAALQKGRTKK